MGKTVVVKPVIPLPPDFIGRFLSRAPLSLNECNPPYFYWILILLVLQLTGSPVHIFSQHLGYTVLRRNAMSVRLLW